MLIAIVIDFFFSKNKLNRFEIFFNAFSFFRNTIFVQTFYEDLA